MAEEVAKPNEYVPSIKLRMFVQTLLTDDVKGNIDETSRRTGVSKGLFYYHLNKKPDFRKWYSNECDRFLAKYEGVATAQLMSKVMAGEDNSIKLYFELLGKRKTGTNVKVGVGVKTEHGRSNNGELYNEDKRFQEEMLSFLENGRHKDEGAV